MAVLSVAEGAVSAAGAEGALHLQTQKAAQAWAHQQQAAGQEHPQARQHGSGLQDPKQQSASPPFIQGPLAALRGYLLSTSGRAVFAVGSFGARQGQQPSPVPVARPGAQDLPLCPPPAPEPGAFGTPARSLVATRALPPHGPGAWWSESSEEVGPTVSGQPGSQPLGQYRSQRRGHRLRGVLWGETLRRRDGNRGPPGTGAAGGWS